MSDVLHHALWDAWIHERDVLLPLSVSPTEEPDEVAACLRYVAAFSPALALCGGSTNTGAFTVSASDPDVAFHVAIDGDVAVHDGAAGAGFVLGGRAVDLVEGLSLRIRR